MSIEKIEGLFAKFVADRYYDNYRKTLDKNPHFIPLDLTTLNDTLGHILVQTPESPELAEAAKAANIEITLPIPELKNKIEQYTTDVIKTRINTNGSKFYNIANEELSGDVLLAKVGNSTNYVNLPARVYKNNELIGVLFPSFGSTSKTLFTDFLNKEISRFIKEEIYEKTSTKIGFDVGHVLDTSSPLFNSPLSLKIQGILGAVDSVLTGKTLFSNAPVSRVESFRDQVDTVFQKLRANSSYGPKISVNIDKDFQSALLSISANVVIIQDRHENQRIYADLFETPVGAEILGLIKDLHFSNNLPEEIEYQVSQAIKTGKVKFSGNSKLNRPTISTVLPELGISVSSGSSGTANNAPPPVRTLSGQFYSLASLQQLLNDNLQNVIAANMGDGTRKDVLNYQTGRFAASVQVERMSQSREGMITAYYNYMKNPYQTFEPGYKQGRPASRDPKLLIAKSIREIAETKVGNRMRAVSV